MSILALTKKIVSTSSFIFLLAVYCSAQTTTDILPVALDGVQHTAVETDLSEITSNSGGTPGFGSSADGWMTTDRNEVLYISDFDVSGQNGAITAVQLMIKYKVESGYTGSNFIMYNNGTSIQTNSQPADTPPTNYDIEDVFDLYAAGVDTWAEIGALDISFNNNDGGSFDAVAFDYIWIRVTTGPCTPPAAPSATDQSCCYGQSVPDLTATGTSLKWYIDAELINPVYTGAVYTTSNTNAGTYTYYVTQTVVCESQATAVSLVIHDLPAVTASSNSPVCAGTAFSLTGGPALMSTYQWTGPNSFSSNAQSPVVTSSATTSTAGSYTLVVTDSYSCTASATTSVMVNSIPSAPLATDASNITDVQFSANWNASTGATAYSLEVSPASDFSTFQSYSPGNVTNFDVTALSSSTAYYYRISAENVCGSGSYSNTISCTTLPPQIAMQFTGAITIQYPDLIYASTANTMIIGIQIATNGTLSPLQVTSFTVNAAGTGNTADIANAKIFYTGSTGSFSTTTQFGSTVASPSVSNFNITGSQTLQNGINYFWLSFDIAANATGGNKVDAQCPAIVIGGVTQNPSPSDPVGFLTIVNFKGMLISGNVTNNAIFDQSNDPNYFVMTGSDKKIEGSGTYNQTKLRVTGTSSITFDGTISGGLFSKTLVDANKQFVISDNRTYKNGEFTNNGSVNLNSFSVFENSGDFTNNASINAGITSTVKFNGSTAQNLKSTGCHFAKVEIINTSAPGLNTGVVLSDDMFLNSTLMLNDGIINTGNYTVNVVSSNPTDVAESGINASTNYSESWVYGNLTREMAVNTGTYDFPVGKETVSYLARLTNKNLDGNGFSSITTHFDPNPVGITGLDLSADGGVYNTVNPGGVWFVTPNSDPATGSYDLKLYFNDFNGLVDEQFGILSRPDISNSSADWIAVGQIDSVDGRYVSNGYALRKNCTSFSQKGIAQSQNPLPVRISRFEAQCSDGEIMINWSTATEIDNDYFTLEKSFDGYNFEALTVIDGKGNNTNNADYTIYDYNPENLTVYYRLRQTDFNGKSTYSQIIPTDCEDIFDYDSPEMETRISGNNLIISFTSSGNESYNLDLFDYRGRLVFSEQTISEPGTNTIEIYAADFPASIYMIVLQNSRNIVSEKVFIR